MSEADEMTTQDLRGLPRTNKAIYLTGGVGAGKTTALMGLLYGAFQEVNSPTAAILVTPDVSARQHLDILQRLHDRQKGVWPRVHHLALPEVHSSSMARGAFTGLLTEGVIVAVEGAAYVPGVRRALASRILATGGRLLMVF